MVEAQDINVGKIPTQESNKLGIPIIPGVRIVHGPAQYVHFFYELSHFRAPRNGHANLSNNLSMILKIK